MAAMVAMSSHEGRQAKSKDTRARHCSGVHSSKQCLFGKGEVKNHSGAGEPPSFMLSVSLSASGLASA